MSVIFMSLGLLFGLISFSYKMLIISDIPVSFTTTEALFSQLLFFIATLFFALFLASIKKNSVKGISIGFLILAFSFNLLVFRTDLANDSPALVQLQIAPVLHLGFLVVLNLFLLIKNWNKSYSLN